MVPILISKYVFEPSYNDLKFTVWNHIYICTNLVYPLDESERQEWKSWLKTQHSEN